MCAINYKLQILIQFIIRVMCIIAQDPIVNLPQGRIVGTKVFTDKSLIPIEIYYGIPYATPPVGRFRFSAPERHAGWRRTLYAHRQPPHCPHIGDIASEINNYSEDCLFLNIWTPRPVDGKPLPVLVILYSESWTRGGVALPCQDLAAEDLLVVTVGYRLHLLGFFTLGSQLARGNLALLDQYLAFLWIQDNIAAFGGDSNAVTVVGHSAGADSVLYHLISPRSKGLFQRAVIMSPINVWKLINEQSYNVSTTVEETSREVALFLGCSSKSDQEILNCMRTRSLSDIMSAYSNINWTKSLQPTPDEYLPESEQYLPQSLLTALSSTKESVMQVDLLLGNTDLEALNYNDKTFYDLLKHNTSYVSDYLNTKAIPELLRMFALYRPEVLPLLVRAIRWEYWDNNYRSKSNMLESIEQVARMETAARWGAGGALLAARLARHVSRLYVYRYSVPSTLDLEGRQLNHTGAVHGSDLISLLGDSLMLQLARRPSTTEEKQHSSLFRLYILRFVKNGYPESNNIWQRYRPGDAQIYGIQNRISSQPDDYKSNSDIKFWLQYLPEMKNLFKASEQTELLTKSEEDEGRLRGGVFAMCGVAIVLLLLLGSSTILLHKQRWRRRFFVSEDAHN